jgi:hypothetical protein
MLKNQDGVQVIYDIEKLEDALNNATKKQRKKSIKNKKLVTFLKGYIKVLEHENLHGAIDSIST